MDADPGLEIIRRDPRGAPAGPPVLCIHGGGMGAWVWSDFLAHFAANGLPAAAVSLRGHGRSRARRRAPVRLDDYVDDAETALASLGDAPVVLGHSLGALVGIRLAARHRLAGLALLAPVAPWGIAASTVELAWRSPETLLEVGQLNGGGGREAVPALPVRLRQALFSAELDDADAFAHIRRMSPVPDSVLAELAWQPPRGVTCPVSVLGGGGDRLFPVHQLRAIAWYFGVQARVFEDMGHAIMLEPRWKEVADHVLEEIRSAR